MKLTAHSCILLDYCSILLLDVARIPMPDVPGTVINCVSAHTTEVEARVKYTVFRGFDAVLLFDTLTLVCRRRSVQPNCMFRRRPSMCYDLFFFDRWFAIRHWNPAASVQCCHVVWEFKIMSYLLTPWSSVHLEKLTGFQLVKKFPAFYGTRRFITAFRSAATCPYPESARSSPYPHIPLSEDPS